MQPAFIYCRGEYLWQGSVLQRAVDEAYAAGYLGRGVCGGEFDLDIVLHRGAGAYICGEETALLSSLEGFRGQPRLRPPFPAVEGLYASPTVINNVETLMNVPTIVSKGAEWFARASEPRGRRAPRCSASRARWSAPATTRCRWGRRSATLLEECAGGVLGGKQLKAWTPGGSSTPLLTAEHLDVGLDFESVRPPARCSGRAR